MVAAGCDPIAQRSAARTTGLCDEERERSTAPLPESLPAAEETIGQALPNLS